jgi:hypothetical protein
MKIGYFARIIDINVYLFHKQTRCWRPKRTVHVHGKGKGTVHPGTGHERSDRYSSTLSLNSALDGVGG